MTIKVLVVDDSALVRSLLSEIIRQAPGLELVGIAADAYIARDMIKQHSPDVITLDIEMPRMDGLVFLEKLMIARPTPVLMISTLTEQGAEATLRALELGAVDFISKPKLGLVEGLRDYAELIVEKLHSVAKARVGKRTVTPKNNRTSLSERFTSTEKIIAIGASTGGTEAIKALLLQFPVATPGIVITQHMPAGFTRSFARRLDKLTRLHVCESQGGERILPGHAYLAPGDKHLLVVRSGADYMAHLSDEPPVNRHRPAVDVMFESVASAAGKNAIALILTGMGKDGAKGIHTIHNQGGYTLAQDEATCVVYGMPREAVLTGAVDKVAPLDELGSLVVDHLNKLGRSNRV